ncbi:glycosyltransferase family 2 protein [Mucilaginibacter calamicampi]|uniref:Glycosyltransferase family 2 protein n=1 Tax=Mucilaginibacter calamicampi TaxID=1302352 RepID=A0ABW2YZ14_9SPHI
MPKQVALILLNWNTPDYTAACIQSLKQYCDEQLFDIIVADNGSTDDSLATLQTRFPGVKFIDNGGNLGFAEGNNRALTYSIDNGYTYSLLINTDTIVDEDIVTALSLHLNSHPNAAAVQPAIYWMHDRSKIWNGEGNFNAVTGVVRSDTNTPGANAITSFKKAKWVTGCCVLLRNSALKKSGLLNKQFFLYFEDVELSYRLAANGYELHYLPSVKIYHEAGVSAKVSAPKKEGHLNPVIHYYVSRNHIWFLRKYGSAAFLPVNALRNALYYGALYVYFKLRGRNQKASNLIRGLKDGLLTPKNLIWPTDIDNINNR